MGILNLTPDSFSDGGQLAGEEDILRIAACMLAEGADILDLGAESTRPSAQQVTENEEWARLHTPLQALIAAFPTAVLSIDTRKPVVAERAIGMGAQIWNDVTALTHSSDSVAMAVRLGCPVVLMHHGAHFGGAEAGDVVPWLHQRAQDAIAAGVKSHSICLDPGIGFGKDTAQSVEALQAVPDLVALGYPVLVGASRKRFIAALDGANPAADQRLGGSVAAHLYAAQAGAQIIRTHDVAETVQALTIWRALT
jgi:dihydropteroate synthase